MNHEIIAHALCGRYTRTSDRAGYIESPMAFPSDGTLIGAYVIATGEDRFHVTDDGDTVFHSSVAGADVTAARLKSYRNIAAEYGLALTDEGVMNATCSAQDLSAVLARYMQAASAIATKSIRHRPKDDERFERIVSAVLLAHYGNRVTKRPEVTGLSGHQLRFPFGLDLRGPRPALIQTIAADDEVIHWKAVYEAGGKFKDVRSARGDMQLIAVLEGSKDVDRASRFFADTASVVIYEGGPLNLDSILAA